MTRRITWTFLTLITALLVLAVVPLGLSMAVNEQSSFRFATEDAARLVSSAAEERLGDHSSAAPVTSAIASATTHGECATVYSPSGTVLYDTTCRVGASPPGRALAARVSGGENPLLAQDGQWLLVAVPVGDSDKKAGTVVFGRSDDPLDDKITVMWGWLTLIGGIGLAMGAWLSVRIARWVSRPLHELGQAAVCVGEGELDARAPAGHGPVEVRQLAGTFNRMAERTENLVHSHRAWVADVSHQLRTPLTALRLRLDLLAEDATGTDAAELGAARDEITRLSRLVDGLLAVARAEAAVPRPAPVRVDAVVTERVAAWEPVARERRISLAAAPCGAVSAYLGDGDLEQMLDNVVANALEAVPDGGEVRIEASAGHSRVTVWVVDNGCGMEPAAKESAFHRFANPGSRGNGLGLAIVSRLVTANGGQVSLRDTVGGGLTVELDLPGVPPHAMARARP